MATFNNVAVPRVLAAAESFGVSWSESAVILVVAIEPFGVSLGTSAAPALFAAEPMPQAGFLMPAAPRTVMRAFNTSLARHVYWEVDEPDPTGQLSGYPLAALTDIVIYHECCAGEGDDL